MPAGIFADNIYVPLVSLRVNTISPLLVSTVASQEVIIVNLLRHIREKGTKDISGAKLQDLTGVDIQLALLMIMKHGHHMIRAIKFFGECY